MNGIVIVVTAVRQLTHQQIEPDYDGDFSFDETGETAEKVNSGVVFTSGRPTVAVVGTQELPAYDLTVRMSARRS